MAGQHRDEYDSDLSEGEGEEGPEITAWLDEEDPEEDDPTPTKRPSINSVVIDPKINIMQKSAYIISHLDLFYALCELEDWEFEKQNDEFQEEIMKTTIVETYKPVSF